MAEKIEYVGTVGNDFSSNFASDISSNSRGIFLSNPNDSGSKNKNQNGLFEPRNGAKFVPGHSRVQSSLQPVKNDGQSYSGGGGNRSVTGDTVSEEPLKARPSSSTSSPRIYNELHRQLTQAGLRENNKIYYNQHMIAFGHAGVGVLVGVATLSVVPEATPFWAIISVCCLASLISHYITDRIPHGHYNFDPANLNWRMIFMIGLDFFVSIGILLGISLLRFGIWPKSVIVAASIVSAQLPDIFEGLVNIGLIPRSRWVDRHRHFHFVIMHSKTPKHLCMPDMPGETRKWGMIDLWQILCFVAAIGALVFF